MRTHPLPDYQPLPEVGETQDFFDTQCVKCLRWYDEREVVDGICVNCFENTEPQGETQPLETGNTR